MSENLERIIDYIYDNFVFGSEVNIGQIIELLDQYPVSCAEEDKVYDELNELQIKLDRSFDEEKNSGNEEIITCDLVKDLDKKEDFLEDGEYKQDDLYENFIFEENSENDLDAILASDAFKAEVEKYKDPISIEHNIDYINKFQNDLNKRKQEEALSNLVVANKRLVWKIVMCYKGVATIAFNTEDMFQVGMQGLIKAAKKFDISKGYKFSTYATWWIKQAITRGIADNSTTIRIPVHKREELSKYIKKKNQFVIEYNRDATIKELSNIAGCSEKEIILLETYLNISNMRSLDKPMGGSADLFLIDILPDEEYKTPEDYAIFSNIRQIVYEELLKLTEKEQRIIQQRYGLKDDITHTLEEIGKQEGVTRERIRQIEAKVLKKLAKNHNLINLKESYDE